MNFEFLSDLGWREALMVVAGLLAIYLVVVFRRVQRLKQIEAQARTAPLSFSANSAVTAYSGEQFPVAAQLPEVAETTAEKEHSGSLGTPDFPFPWNESPATTPEQRIITLEIEIDQLRKEVGGLRAELMMMRESRPKEEIPSREEPKPPVTQFMAPQYDEAMQLALKDVDAVSISQQCGITRAEAELVAALVKNRDR